MGLQHVVIVHAIELVARENQHVLRVVLLDVAKVLGDCVRGALIPRAARLSGVGRKDRDAAAALVEVPGLARADVAVQQVRTILGENTHRGDS